MKRALTLLLIAILCLPALPAAAYSPPDYIPEEDLPRRLRSMPEGSGFVQALYIDDGYWYILTETADGCRTLRIFKDAGGDFVLQAESAPLPEISGARPSIHAGYASVTIMYSEGRLYGFSPDTDGTWRMSFMQGETAYHSTRYWLLEHYAQGSRLLYAENTSPLLGAFDPLLYPPDLSDAAKTLNIAGYAMVNNPNPADRLHLRSKPDRNAESLGKYYNGAPVYIQEDLGDWARVSVAGVAGYMMKKFLAVGADMLDVTSAFADLFIRPELAGQELSIYTAPDHESAPAGISYDRGAGRVYIVVIGIAGEDWLHVITADGMAGYMPAEDFYPGNG